MAVQDWDCDCPTRWGGGGMARAWHEEVVAMAVQDWFPLAEALDCLAEVVRWQLMQLPTSAEW